MTITQIAKQACQYAKQQNWQLNGEIQDMYLAHLEKQGAPENHLDLFIAAYDSFLVANGQKPLSLSEEAARNNINHSNNIFTKV